MHIPGIVTIGVPAQSTSMPVVCPLHSGVSRHTSASCPRLTCSSFGATGEKIIRFVDRPMPWAYCWILGSPTAGNRRSHSTLLGTRFKICKVKEMNFSNYLHYVNAQVALRINNLQILASCLFNMFKLFYFTIQPWKAITKNKTKPKWTILKLFSQTKSSRW